MIFICTAKRERERTYRVRVKHFYTTRLALKHFTELPNQSHTYNMSANVRRIFPIRPFAESFETNRRTHPLHSLAHTRPSTPRDESEKTYFLLKRIFRENTFELLPSVCGCVVGNTTKEQRSEILSHAYGRINGFIYFSHSHLLPATKCSLAFLCIRIAYAVFMLSVEVDCGCY